LSDISLPLGAPDHSGSEYLRTNLSEIWCRLGPEERSSIEHVDHTERSEERVTMKKLIATAMLAGFVTITGASTAMAATARTDNSTGAPAYQRCRAAGGTDHFCGELGGYVWFQ
jgi:hypothetical protein